MDTQGIQKWTVPASGVYSIRAAGAAGGYQSYAQKSGGYGAVIESHFQLLKGSILNIIVGQKGEDLRRTASQAAPGGGGGTFVYKNAYDLYPLIAAGGGGGGSEIVNLNKDASLSTTGQSSSSGALGGKNGNGGGINQGGWSYWAGGGAGWETDGTGGNSPNLNNYSPGDQGAQGGRSPRNGAVGGIRWNDGYDEGGDGGFGGGGGGGSASMGTGGGGGYSGGGGANFLQGSQTKNHGGGGGASYSMSKFVFSAVNNADHGYVIITFLDYKSPIRQELYYKKFAKIFAFGVIVDLSC